MTPAERLAAIAARADTATPGPWEFGDRFHVAGVGYGFGDDRCCYCDRKGAPTFDGRGWLNGKRARIHVHTSEPGTGWKHGIVAVREDGPLRVVNDTDEYGYMDEDDAAFIAAARQDVPDLVAFAQAVLALCDEADNDDTAHILYDVRRLADEHLGGA